MEKIKPISCFVAAACVNGACPKALDELDRNSDTDAYASYHLDSNFKCTDCFAYTGKCSDCIFEKSSLCPEYKFVKELNREVNFL